VRFKADPRLCDFRPTTVKSLATWGKNKGVEVEKAAYTWRDRQLGLDDRPATIGGVKLMFDLRSDGTPRAAHLVFTCDVQSLPLTERASETRNEFSEENTASGKKKFRGRTIPDGLVSLAVDIGIRHVGFATLVRWNAKKQLIEPLRARNIHLDSPETGAPDLAALARHKRTLKLRRRLRGDPIKGEASHVELQRHIDHMADDRFKKAARAIINLALNASADQKDGRPYPRADVLILENLANLLPDAEKERGVNTALIEFNRGHLVDRVKELAEDVGLKVFEISPVGTSQVCHRCGGLGRRYAIRRVSERPGERAKPEIVFAPTASLFACPNCQALGKKHRGAPYTCNSDYNASMNLQLRFFRGDDAVRAYPAGQRNKAQRDAAFLQIDAPLAARLARLHGLGEPVPETPW
jgi:hypothetical protein